MPITNEIENMTISIHTLTAADLDRADAIQQAAYGGGSRKDRLQLYLSLQPDGWLLATLDGEEEDDRTLGRIFGEELPSGLVLSEGPDQAG